MIDRSLLNGVIVRAERSIGDEASRVVFDVLSLLDNDLSVTGIFIQGSFTRGNHDAFSDIDAIVIVRNSNDGLALAAKVERWGNSNACSFIGHTERYPWFGHLVALYWDASPNFACDIGVIEQSALATFTIEPEAIILKDISGEVSRRRDLSAGVETVVIRDAEYQVYSLLFKTRKSIARIHLWNAIEYVAQLRRLWMSLVVESSMPTGPRIDRNIEDVLPPEILSSISNTAVSYDARVVIMAAVQLAGLIVGLPAIRAWKQRDAIEELIHSIKEQVSC
jgi:hypothetical protein